MARLLVLSLMIVTLSFAQAFAQNCAPRGTDVALDAIGNLEGTSMNFSSWIKTSPNHRDVPNVEFIQSVLRISHATSDHIYDLLLVSNVISDRDVILYTNGRLGYLRNRLQDHVKAINIIGDMITHHRMKQEVQTAKVTIEKVLTVIANC